jgi:hypothetical protein
MYLTQGDFVVTTNVGRAIYIVYSLFTIPIMTILVSLMSDSVLSKFQKSAERFGIKGEDQRTKEHELKRRKFRRARKPPSGDVETGRIPTASTGDEILREEILDELESLEQHVENQVDTDLGLTEGSSQGEAARNQDNARRRRRVRRARQRGAGQRRIEDLDEEDVERAIQEEEAQD